jgi:hypothetical protein
MKYLSGILAAAAVSALASTASAGIIYADNVESFTQGMCDANSTVGPLNANDCAVSRSDPTAALGAEDGDFVSLGFFGEIILSFAGNTVFPGGGTTVYEVTTNRRNDHDEALDVFSSLGGVETFIGTIFNNVASSSLLVAGTFDSLILRDVTLTYFADTTSFDGFDLDAVSISPVPLPAGGLLLLAGIGGFAALRRRKSV